MKRKESDRIPTKRYKILLSNLFCSEFIKPVYEKNHLR